MFLPKVDAPERLALRHAFMRSLLWRIVKFCKIYMAAGDSVATFRPIEWKPALISSIFSEDIKI